MIQKTITYKCRVCGSTRIVKYGTNRLKQRQHYGKDCGVRRVLKPKQQAKNATIAAATSDIGKIKFDITDKVV